MLYGSKPIFSEGIVPLTLDLQPGVVAIVVLQFSPLQLAVLLFEVKELGVVAIVVPLLGRSLCDKLLCYWLSRYMPL
jgi:hypothetical protein